MKAGLLRRFSSTLMDSVVLLLLSFVFVSLLFSLTGVDYYSTELINESGAGFNKARFLLFFDTSLGIFISFLLSEVLVPLLLGRGETIGKKIFSLFLIRLDEKRVGGGTLILRALGGKYLMESLPVVFLSLHAFFSCSGVCLLIAFLLVILNVSLTVFSKNHRALHDIISGTVVVEKERETEGWI